MDTVSARLLAAPDIANDDVARVLVPIVTSDTGISSAGYPYLNARAFARFRDTVPHILGMGLQVWRAVERIETTAANLDLSEQDQQGLARGVKVVRTVLRTAAVTAPPDLWLLRQVVGTHRSLGLLGPLLDGSELSPANCSIDTPTGHRQLRADELEADLDFLVARGLLTVGAGRYGAREQPRARRVLEELTPSAPDTVSTPSRCGPGRSLASTSVTSRRPPSRHSVRSSRRRRRFRATPGSHPWKRSNWDTGSCPSCSASV